MRELLKLVSVFSLGISIIILFSISMSNHKRVKVIVPDINIEQEF